MAGQLPCTGDGAPASALIDPLMLVPRTTPDYLLSDGRRAVPASDRDGNIIDAIRRLER